MIIQKNGYTKLPNISMSSISFNPERRLRGDWGKSTWNEFGTEADTLDDGEEIEFERRIDWSFETDGTNCGKATLLNQIKI